MSECPYSVLYSLLNKQFEHYGNLVYYAPVQKKWAKPKMAKY